MSAYAKGHGNQVISFTPPAHAGSPNPGPTNLSETLAHLPSLPQIAGELESFFNIARQIEAALLQEKSYSRRYREELRELQSKYSHLATEIENRQRDFTLREERMKLHFATWQKNERGLRDQLQGLTQQLEHLQEERRKTELEVELLKANLEHSKNRESSLNRSLQTFQSGDKFRTDREEKLRRDLQTVQAELHRYKIAWGQVSAMDQKAKQALEELYESKKKVEDLTEALQIEKRRREDLEEQVKKEKREKQLALTCLHTAESRLAQASNELENVRRHNEESQSDASSLELNF